MLLQAHCAAAGSLCCCRLTVLLQAHCAAAGSLCCCRLTVLLQAHCAAAGPARHLCDYTGCDARGGAAQHSGCSSCAWALQVYAEGLPHQRLIIISILLTERILLNAVRGAVCLGPSSLERVSAAAARLVCVAVCTHHSTLARRSFFGEIA